VTALPYPGAGVEYNRFVAHYRASRRRETAAVSELPHPAPRGAAMARMPPPMPLPVRYALAIASLVVIVAGALVWSTHVAGPLR